MANPGDAYKPSAIGCAAGMASLIGLVAGIYHGVNDSFGSPVSPGLEKALMYGPSFLGGIIGPSLAKKALEDPEIRAQMPPVPAEQEGCAAGCSGVLSGLLIPAGFNAAGYFIGRFIGDNVKR